jgi:hypothetical protein
MLMLALIGVSTIVAVLAIALYVAVAWRHRLALTKLYAHRPRVHAALKMSVLAHRAPDGLDLARQAVAAAGLDKMFDTYIQHALLANFTNPDAKFSEAEKQQLRAYTVEEGERVKADWLEDAALYYFAALRDTDLKLLIAKGDAKWAAELESGLNWLLVGTTSACFGEARRRLRQQAS